jgi:hypothetical protein
MGGHRSGTPSPNACSRSRKVFATLLTNGESSPQQLGGQGLQQLEAALEGTGLDGGGLGCDELGDCDEALQQQYLANSAANDFAMFCPNCSCSLFSRLDNSETETDAFAAAFGLLATSLPAMSLPLDW